MANGGQILGGTDAAQGLSGATGAAFVPNQEYTHIAQNAIEHIQDRNRQYQLEKQAKEERAAQNRIAAMQGVSIDTKGVRPVDREKILDLQKGVNTYMSLALARGKDPRDPKNKKEFTEFNALMNTATNATEISTMLGKHEDEAAKTFMGPEGKNIDDKSVENIKKSKATPFEKVNYSDPLLVKKNKYDPIKRVSEITKKLGDEGTSVETRNPQTGQVEKTTVTKGNDTPEMRTELGKELTADEGFTDYANEAFNRDPDLAVTLETEARARRANGESVTRYDVLAQNMIRPHLSKIKTEKVIESPEAKEVRDMNKQDHAAYLKYVYGTSKEGDEGYQLYPKLADVASGSPNAYIQHHDGLFSTALSEKVIGTYNDPADKSKSKANHILETRYIEGADGKPTLYVRTNKSEDDAKTANNKSLTWMPEPDFIGHYGPLIIENLYPKNAKAQSAALDALNANAAEFGEYQPNTGKPYNTELYKNRTAPQVGRSYQKDIADLQADADNKEVENRMQKWKKENPGRGAIYTDNYIRRFVRKEMEEERAEKIAAMKEEKAKEAKPAETKNKKAKIDL